jgi:hypothetical protein
MSLAYDPEGRQFESVRAHHKINGLGAAGGKQPTRIKVPLRLLRHGARRTQPSDRRDDGRWYSTPRASKAALPTIDRAMVPSRNGPI